MGGGSYGSAMTFVGLDPDLVDQLASTLRTQATAADESASRIADALALADLTSGVSNRLVARAEDWRTAAATLENRAILGDDFTLDLTAGLGPISSGSILARERAEQRAREAAVAAFAEAHGLSLDEAQFVVDCFLIDDLTAAINAWSGSDNDPIFDDLVAQRRDLIAAMIGEPSDADLEYAFVALINSGVPAIEAAFGAAEAAFSDASIAELATKLEERMANADPGEAAAFDPFVIGLATLHAQRIEDFTGVDALDVHPGVAAMAQELGITYNEGVALFNAEFADGGPDSLEALPFIDSVIATEGEVAVLLSDETLFREIETANQVVSGDGDIDDFDGRLSLTDIQKVLDNPHLFSAQAVAIAAFLDASPEVVDRFDTARNGDFLRTVGEGEYHVGDTDGIVSYADVLAMSSNRWVFDTLSNLGADDRARLDGDADGVFSEDEFRSFIETVEEPGLRAALEYAISSGLDTDDRGLLETVWDSSWEISSLLPGSPAFFTEAARDPRGHLENYVSFAQGAGGFVLGMGQFAYDVGASGPSSPLFWLESWRVDGDMERHRGMRLVTALPDLVEAGLSLVPGTPQFERQLEGVRHYGTWDVHMGVNLGLTVLDWETFRDDPSKWAGQLAPEVLITVLTGGSGAATRAATTAQRLARLGRNGLARLRRLDGELLADLRHLIRSSAARGLDDLPDFVKDAMPRSDDALDAYLELVGMLEDAADAKVEIDDLANRIAIDFDGTVAAPPLKGLERAFEKIMVDYGGDAGRISDLARNTIVVDADDIAGVVAELERAGATVKIVDGAVDELGYSGVNAKIETESGIVAEIQVNSPEMIFAKESEANARAILGDEVYELLDARFDVPGGRGHELYEEWRSLPPSSDRRQEIAEESRAYYENFRGES